MHCSTPSCDVDLFHVPRDVLFPIGYTALDRVGNNSTRHAIHAWRCSMHGTCGPPCIEPHLADNVQEGDEHDEADAHANDHNLHASTATLKSGDDEKLAVPIAAPAPVHAHATDTCQPTRMPTPLQKAPSP